MGRDFWNTKDVANSSSIESHLTALEEELKKTRCSRLEEHIRLLKASWGVANQTPEPQGQAA